MNNHRLWLTLGSMLNLLVSCSEDDPLDDFSNNQIPRSNAGPDIAITLPVDSVMLSGHASDQDGLIVKTEWLKTNGPNDYIIESPFQLSAKVKGLKGGTYTFTLKVTDNQGLSGRDDMMVKVRDTSNHDSGEGDWDY